MAVTGVRLRGVIGTFPAAFWWLVLGMFVNRLGAFVLPFLSLYLKQHEGFDARTIGFTMSCWGAGTVLAALLGGQLSDRWGRKGTMLVSLCGGAAVLSLLSQVHTPGWFGLLALALGAVAELYRPAVSAAITDLVRPEQRAQAFAHLTWAYNLGFAFCPLLAGRLVTHQGYGWLFAGDAATMALAALLIALVVPETRPDSAALPGSSSTGVLTSLREVLRDSRLRAMLLVALLIGTIVIQFAVSLAHVLRADGIGTELYGRILALNGVLIVFVQPWLVPRLEQLGRARVLPFAAVLFGLGFGAHALVDGPWAHAAVVALWTMGEMALFPMCNAVVADLAPEHLRGRTMGVYWMAWASANALGPNLGMGALAWGGPLAWGALLAVAGAAAALVLTRVVPSKR